MKYIALATFVVTTLFLTGLAEAKHKHHPMTMKHHIKANTCKPNRAGLPPTCTGGKKLQ